MQQLGILVVSLTLFFFPAASLMAVEQSGNLPASIESNSIALMDAVLVNDTKTMRENFTVLQQQVDALHASIAGRDFDERTAREVTMVYSWMRLVKINIANKSMLGTAIAANQLSGEMVRFRQDLAQKNWDAHWLAYLGRELTLLVMESPTDNAELLDSRRHDAVNTWQRLRQEIIKNFRDKPMVEEGDKIIDKLNANSDQLQTIELGRDLEALMQKVMQSAGKS